MNQVELNEAISKLVLDDIQRLNQQFIREAIRVWDAGQVRGIPFCLWIKISTSQLWQAMTKVN